MPDRVKLDLSSSIKSWSIAAVRNDFAVFMFSSFLWSSQIVYVSKPSSKWGPSSPGQELLCVPRRKFANLDLLRIRHFEKFDFRSDTHGTGLIHGKYQTGNRAVWLVDFLYQPSQELSRVIMQYTAHVWISVDACTCSLAVWTLGHLHHNNRTNN